MNFNALVASVQAELNDYSARSKTRIEKWINDGHRMICQSRSWNFLKACTSDDMTFTSASFPISLLTAIKIATVTTEIAQVYAVYDITDSTFQEVKQSTLEKVREQYQTDYSQDGPPEFWYPVKDNYIDIYPAISANRIFQFSVKKRLSTYATGSTAALLIPDDYINVLEEYVIARAYRYKSDDRANSAMQSHLELLQGMIAAEADKAGIIEERPGGYTGRFPMIVEIP